MFNVFVEDRYFICVTRIVLYNVLSVISISYSFGPSAIHQRQQVA